VLKLKKSVLEHAVEGREEQVRAGGGGQGRRVAAGRGEQQGSRPRQQAHAPPLPAPRRQIDIMQAHGSSSAERLSLCAAAASSSDTTSSSTSAAAAAGREDPSGGRGEAWPEPPPGVPNPCWWRLSHAPDAARYVKSLRLEDTKQVGGGARGGRGANRAPPGGKLGGARRPRARRCHGAATPRAPAAAHHPPPRSAGRSWWPSWTRSCPGWSRRRRPPAAPPPRPPPVPPCARAPRRRRCRAARASTARCYGPARPTAATAPASRRPRRLRTPG
jgi:hypothetical protein